MAFLAFCNFLHIRYLQIAVFAQVYYVQPLRFSEFPLVLPPGLMASFSRALFAVSFSGAKRCSTIGTAPSFRLDNGVVDLAVLLSHARFEGRVFDKTRVWILVVLRAKHLVFEILAGLALHYPAFARLPERLTEDAGPQTFFLRITGPVGTLVFDEPC